MEKVKAITDRLNLQQGETPVTLQNNATCSKCSGIGWIVSDAGAKRCQCWIDKLLDRTIPKRFQSCNFDNFKPRDKQQEKAKNTIQSKITGSFFISGIYGRGKTHLLFAQYRELTKTGKRCYVRTTKEIIDELIAESLEKSPSPVLEAIASPSRVHLFWDDADKMKPTEFKYEVLYDLVDKIYRREHGLTLTSNCNLMKLNDILTPAMVRRIDDICDAVIDL